MFPTPMSSDFQPGSKNKRYSLKGLGWIAQHDATFASKFPTPVARDWKGASGRSYKGEKLDLPAFCQQFPTPNASDYIQRKTSKSWTEQGRTNYVLSNPEVTGVTGGQLNPDWVELLMGYPLGWTKLDPLPIAEFNLWYEGNTTKDNDRYGAIAWQSGTWEQGVTRTVGKGFPHRRERLQAIGNGQVPQALRIAWSILVKCSYAKPQT